MSKNNIENRMVDKESLCIITMKKILVTFVSLLLSCSYIFSQLKDWKNYTNTEMVICMLSDADNLWIGTNGGIVKLNKSTGEKYFYNRCDGLPSTKISALTMNDRGDLWASSENCIISKFNGVGFDILESTVTIPDKPAQNNLALHIDQLERLWYGALAIYTKDIELGTEKILRWKAPNTAFSTSQIVTSYLFTTINEEDILYIGGQIGVNSLLKFDGKELIPVLKGKIWSTVTGLAPGENGSIWIATQGDGLINYAMDETMTTYNISNSSIPDNFIYDMQLDYNGNYWLACGHFLVKFDGKEFVTYQTNLIDQMNNMNYILSILPDEDGTVWVGTKKQGLFKFVNGEFTAVNINPTFTLTNNYMAYSMCMDRMGNIWNAGRQDLLHINTSNEWHSLFKLNEENISSQNRIQAVECDSEGNVWLALSMSDTCVVKMSPEGKIIEAFTRSVHPLLAAGSQRESCFAFDLQGNIWWGTYAGLYLYNGNKWVSYTTNNSPIPCNAITDLKVDSKGDLWGTIGFKNEKGGLFKYNGSTWTIYTTENSPLPTTFAICLDIDSQNRVWLHCRDKNGYVGKNNGSGLTCFDGKVWTSYTTENSDIPSNTIWDITIDKYDRVWIGTAETGLTCLNNDGTWNNYNTMNSGIATNEVSCILVDEYRNQIWMNHLYGGGMSSALFDNGYQTVVKSFFTNTYIQFINQPLSIIAPNAKKVELYNMNAIKVNEAIFFNGKACLRADVNPATYIYVVTYLNGQVESGKVIIK